MQQAIEPPGAEPRERMHSKTVGVLFATNVAFIDMMQTFVALFSLLKSERFRMTAEFADQVVVVTGAAQGLGLAVARKFADAGAVVFMSDVQAGKLDTAASEISRGGGCVHPVAVDGANPESLRDLRATIEKTAGGRLDVLINNAGGWRYGTAKEITATDWSWTFRTNVDTVFFTTQALMDLMITRRYGRIVNVASSDAYRPKVKLPHYAAAKAAVVSLTKSLAEELAPYEILVNGVSPGAMLTQTARQQNWLAERIKSIPLGRAAEPEEIADLILFLASPRNRFMAGETVIANGGLWMV
jgi:NAD(P)-dependent dehydrogenase (short-subunit alcohol dehydrogenase family)